MEERLGVALPPSYREFLQVTDGWDLGMHLTVSLLPAAEIGWARDMNNGIVEAWRPDPDDPLPEVPDDEYFVYGPEQDCAIHLRTEYFPDLLYVSGYHEGQAYFLNPRIVFPDGEWEAWDFASWYPGAVRHRSFRELMESEFAAAKRRDRLMTW
ncbi:hypothetical protein HerbRD11066_03940 [Herbidospora sp. RD11066]